MLSKNKVTPPSLPFLGSFSHGIRLGNWLFISGQVAVDQNGSTLYKGNVSKQARVVFENIGKVLAEAGVGFQDIIKVTAFLTDQSHYHVYNELRKEYFPEKDIASSAIIVAGLVKEDWLIEVEAVAYIDESKE